MKPINTDFTRAIWEFLGWEAYGVSDRVEIKEITQDSREVKRGVAFFAYDGHNVRGKDFIWDALAKHAAAIFIDRDYKAEILADERYKSDQPIFFSPDFLRGAGRTISFLLGEPTRYLTTVGVTGTNGKTTVAHSLFQALNHLNKASMYIGTLGMEITKHKITTGMTTPDAITSQRMLAQGLKQKALYACLETSSHGLAQGRLEGINFQIGIFTNLTQDHLDYHHNMESYYRAKRRLFEYMLFSSRKAPESVKGAIICIDDDYGRRLYQWLKNQNPSFPVISLSLNEKSADAHVTDVQATFEGYSCTLVVAQKSYFIKTQLLGRFNLMNLSSCFLALLCLGFSTSDALAAIQKVEPVPGRFEVLRGKEQRTVIVDYAHSPDALTKVLETAQELTPARVIGLFGCGGDRDKEKRPQMAEVASMHADLCILTNDNPRSEDPKTIIEEMRKGLKTARYLVITDREKAIRAGLQILGPRQVLVIAGKGHEDYQVIGNRTTYFSDREVALKLMGVLKIR
ncbi:MAG: UDP-N-acetylmuramoyl-L-alanyl-D-glutamate--2,6-diaminopimelate ligase [Spirochaetes bacterium]|nr:UDP-N-acetylmuramoyl-L-alanyl-D-glutamate--2,6-diaminopimelate ligase [Spirochaetota bacterium]